MPKLKQVLPGSGVDEAQNTLRNIELLREYYGFKKEKLAKLAHISYSTICNRYNNPDSFTFRELKCIAKALHTTVSKLTSKVEISLVETSA